MILGDSMDVKDMDSGDQHEAATLDVAVALVRDAFAGQTAASGEPRRDAPAKDAPA